MRKIISLIVALGFVAGTAIGENRLVPAMGISQDAADGRYVNVTGDTVTGSLAVDGDVTIGDAVGDTATVNAGTFTFVNPLTVNLDAATTIDATGFTVTLLGTSWDYRGASNVFVPDGTFDEHAVNIRTGHTLWGQLATANTFTKANIFNGDMTIGDAVGDTVDVNAGTWTFHNPLTVDLDAATLIDNSGFTLTIRANIVDFTTVTSGVRVPAPVCPTCAVSLQIADARYVAQTSVKSGTVAGGTFAGNPKTFTVTFGTAFPDANYSVSVISEEGRTWTFQSKLAGSFVMNSNANLALTLNVDWVAIAHNDP